MLRIVKENPSLKQASNNLISILTEKLNIDELLRDITIYNLAVAENKITQEDFLNQHMRNSASANLKILMAVLLLLMLEIQYLRSTYVGEYSYSVQLAIFAVLIPLNSKLFSTPIKNALSCANFFTPQEINVNRIQALRRQLIDIENIDEADQITVLKKNVETISKAKIANCLELSYLAAGKLFNMPELNNRYINQISLERDHVVILISSNKLDDNVHGKKLNELSKGTILIDLWYKIIQEIDNLPSSHDRLNSEIVKIHYSLLRTKEKSMMNLLRIK